MESYLESQIAIIAIGSYLTVLGFRENYRCNALTILLASWVVTGLVLSQIPVQHFGELVKGEPFQVEFNFLWGLGSYVVGLMLCHRFMPRFSVDWCPMMYWSVLPFSLYYGLASSMGTNGLVFLLLLFPCLVFSILLPITPHVEPSNIFIMHHWD